MAHHTKEMKKKQAAAIAAVTAYIKGQEAVMSCTGIAPSAFQPQTPWGISHRADMMNLRSMMQMKAFHGARLR